MKDLERLTGRSRSSLIQNFLNRPDVLKRIEPFTAFPKGKGSDWIFQATKLREYLENEFLDVLKRWLRVDVIKIFIGSLLFYEETVLWCKRYFKDIGCIEVHSSSQNPADEWVAYGTRLLCWTWKNTHSNVFREISVFERRT